MNELFRPFAQPCDRAALRPLRARQALAIEQIKQAVREGHKRIILQAPCGFGKTLTAAHLFTSALEKGKRPLFTCPAIALVNQTLAAFEAEGILDIGVMQGVHERTDHEAAVQIASVQTLIRRKTSPFDFAIIDEAHLLFEKLNERLDSDEWAGKIVLGFTATPWAKGMGRRWTKLIVAATTQELIAEGWLCAFEVFAPPVDPDLSKVRTTAGDYNEGDLADVMDEPTITADIVKTWLEKGEGRSTFLFAVNRAHAASLQEEFRKAGISCGYIDGFSTAEERFETFRRFRDGDDRIIASVGCLIQGVDEDVRCLIDGAPTKSEIRHVQKIGRGLRTAEGKDKCIILDHAGNSLRLGLVTDIHHDALNTKQKGERDAPIPGEKPVAKPRKCKDCGRLLPPGARACPSCGAVNARPSDVIVEEGELVAFGSGSKQPKASRDSKQELYSGLLWIANDRGYSKGWAAHAYKEKFGVWPRGLAERTYPTLAAQNFEAVRRLKRARARIGKGIAM